MLWGPCWTISNWYVLRLHCVRLLSSTGGRKVGEVGESGEVWGNPVGGAVRWGIWGVNMGAGRMGDGLGWMRYQGGCG